MAGDSKLTHTQYGFNWGPASVERTCSEKGWVIVSVKSKKHPQGLQVYVTKTGKIRVYLEGKELK